MRTLRCGARGGQDERRFGEIELARERLHRRRVEGLGALEHAQRIAGEHAAILGEHVDDAKCELGHGELLQ